MSDNNISPPLPNAGLSYPGAPVCSGGHCAIPVQPTVSAYSRNLMSANPPPVAALQYPGTVRLGNNTQNMPGIGLSQVNNSHIQCIKPSFIQKFANMFRK